MNDDIGGWVIAYLAIFAAIILFGVLAIKFFLWWDGIFVILGILCGLGIFVGLQLEEKLKERRKKK